MFQIMNDLKESGIGRQQNSKSLRSSKSPKKGPILNPSQLSQTKTSVRTKAQPNQKSS